MYVSDVPEVVKGSVILGGAVDSIDSRA